MNEQQTTTNGWVQVALMGGDVQTLDIPEGGMTIREAITSAEVELGQGRVVTVNGERITDLDAQVEPNSILTVVSAVKNG